MIKNKDRTKRKQEVRSIFIKIRNLLRMTRFVQELKQSSICVTKVGSLKLNIIQI
jgi:hypothetical protein